MLKRQEMLVRDIFNTIMGALKEAREEFRKYLEDPEVDLLVEVGEQNVPMDEVTYRAILACNGIRVRLSNPNAEWDGMPAVFQTRLGSDGFGMDETPYDDLGLLREHVLKQCYEIDTLRQIESKNHDAALEKAKGAATLANLNSKENIPPVNEEDFTVEWVKQK